MKINCDTSSISPMDGMMGKIRAAQESEIGQRTVFQERRKQAAMHIRYLQ
jgi:hypothetical protein